MTIGYHFKGERRITRQWKQQDAKQARLELKRAKQQESKSDAGK